MSNLSDQEKEKIKQLIDAGKPIPSVYRSKLFVKDDTEYIEATADYKLVYKGKARKEDIIANTPAAPLQKIRSFNSDNPHDDDWSNMLIFGDNLLALKSIYEDQRSENKLKTKNKIKLIYIDPPFATKHDFMKDKEKAYRDKVFGAKFLEFLRKRIILLREILADDGAIYIHLDLKKAHYVKVLLDEVFGEANFMNELIWLFSGREMTYTYYNNKHNNIFMYAKNRSQMAFNWEVIGEAPSKEVMGQYKHTDKDGRKYVIRNSSGSKGLKEEGPDTYRQYYKPVPPRSWFDIPIVSSGNENIGYPTQKPEQLLSKFIMGSSKQGDIVLDCFSGSGTTIAVAEKLSRRWISIDVGKLSIYTAQKRMMNLNNLVGSPKKDKSNLIEQWHDLDLHLNSDSRGLLFVLEKARKGDLIITDTLLKALSNFITTHLSGKKVEEFSIVCPVDKFQVKELEVIENSNNSEAKAGEKVVVVDKVKFLISFIQEKEKIEKPKPLKAKEFKLYHAGIYDNEAILDMDWDHYRPFVMQLFNLRENAHKIGGLEVDGYIGTHSAYIWDYPNHKDTELDEEYVNTLHEVTKGKGNGKLYVIAPISSMGFMQDEIVIGNTTYSFLKVPLSILMAIIEKGEPGALKQPVSEDNVNEIIDAVGFDFISQPVVEMNYSRKDPLELDLLNQGKKDFVIKIDKFLSKTLAQDPEDFENFETLSMVMVDYHFNGNYFNLGEVFWRGDILNEEETEATIRIPEDSFVGEKMMIIYMDKYGNELKVEKTKKEFK